MSQDKEAMIVLVLGIFFCLIIIITSYSMDHSKFHIVDQWNAEDAVFHYDLTLNGL
jgi:hypothetical protein